MKAITVHQPYGWALIHGGKSPENRPRNIVGDYRGPVAIHAGLKVDHEAITSAPIVAAWQRKYGWDLTEYEPYFETGVIVGVVDVVGVHDERLGCCRPWGQRSHDGSRRVHIEVANPRSLGWLTDPITARGYLGLWTPDEATQERIDSALVRLAEIQARQAGR